MDNKTNRRIVFEGVRSIFVGILTISFFLLIVMSVFRSPWWLILFGPIYIFVVAGYVWVTILDIYKSLANNRRGNIIRDYPHVFVDSFKETDGVKEYRTFLRIPDSEWEKREKEMVRRAEEQKRHEEYINSELAEIERLAPHGVETWLKKNNINAIRREDNQEDNNSDYRGHLQTSVA